MPFSLKSVTATPAWSDVNTATRKKEFAADVIKGLTGQPKKLSSKYFYDSTGSRLFQQIMELPEYYLTRTETEIFRQQQKEIVFSFLLSKTRFNLVDLGAGDAAKTKILLKALLDQKAIFQYIPVDISADALQDLESALTRELPHLAVQPVASDYFAALNQLQKSSTDPKVVFLLGSNIGNFETQAIRLFARKLRRYLNNHDQVLIGFDLKKDPHLIRQAYDDAAGVTAAFNFNLLHRINQEFNGNIQVDQFKHFAEYNPLTGDMKSYLISNTTQQIYLADLNQAFSLAAWEPIHTETSHKFSLLEIEQLSQEAGLVVEQVFTDANYYFADVLFKVV